MANNSVEIKFNPTASVMQFNGSNSADIAEWAAKHGVATTASAFPAVGGYVVIFMGQVSTMTEAQYRSAQGLV